MANFCSAFSKIFLLDELLSDFFFLRDFIIASLSEHFSVARDIFGSYSSPEDEGEIIRFSLSSIKSELYK